MRGGASGHELYRATCELFSEHGYKTLLTKDLGETLEEGFFHGLGHGVGLKSTRTGHGARSGLAARRR